MSRRQRKFVGTILLVLLVPVYAMIAVELSRYALAGASWWLQAIVFLLLGLAWAFPVMPLIRWMERLTPEEEAAKRAAPPR